ncbi:hypothetical protein M422DRAFT_225452 [Sphaerobolus stellatus SS14]|nr:hypothetical protein M422DRAFT_225452 [Sphaerobolus stellatus SS14]
MPISSVEYVIFDLDGLLIDSESIYTKVTNDILARYGKEMTFDIKAGLMGKPERAASEHLLSFFPDIDLTVDDYIQERREKQNLSWPTVAPLPGAVKLVKHLKKHNIPIAIATGSGKEEIKMKTSLLPELIGPFDGYVTSADDVKRGKPNPDVFLAAAERLARKVGEGDNDEVKEDYKIERSKGLVFEDAIPGVRAALRAGMNVVWIPDTRITSLDESKDLRPQQTLRSLEDFKPEEWGLPAYD